MQGVLFKYGPGSAHVAFKTGPQQGQRHLVLVGGLTDGLLFAPYAPKLAAAISSMGWSLVQAQLTSSYQGWGLASLDQDAAELKLLSSCLLADHGCEAWVLMGHSTGCQDAVRYVQRYRQEDKALAGVILQAPVSDREYLSMYPSWTSQVSPAQEMVAAGRGDEVLCRVREWDGAALTARRFLSLYAAGGDDDMFSTDLSLEQLQEVLGPLQGLPCQIIQSGSDEAVPQELRDSGRVEQLAQHMAKAIKAGTHGAAHAAAAGAEAMKGPSVGAADSDDGNNEGQQQPPQQQHQQQQQQSSLERWPQLAVVPGAGHACSGHEDELVSLVSRFLQLL